MKEESSSEEGSIAEKKVELGYGTILFHMESEVERKIKEETKSAMDSELKTSKSRFELQDNNEPAIRNKTGKFNEVANAYIPYEKTAIKKQIIGHIERTLGKPLTNITEGQIFDAVILSIRDRLFECLNDTNQRFTDSKILYYVTLETIQYTSLKRTLLNLGLESQYSQALKEMGYNLEDMYVKDNCIENTKYYMMDELTTINCPIKSYGLMYEQTEDTFQITTTGTLTTTSRSLGVIKDSQSPILIKFGGKVFKSHGKVQWEAEDLAAVISYNTGISGYNTFHTNEVKRFKACSINNGKNFKPKKLTMKRYKSNAEEKLYKIKQDYLLAAATVGNIMRNHDKNKLSKEVAIYLTDASGALMMIELFRVLLDEHDLKYEQAFEIIKKVFTYECTGSEDSYYEVPIIEKVLPRHLELIYLLNHNFLELVKSTYSPDVMRKLSWIEESDPKKVRLIHICYTLSQTCLVFQKNAKSFLTDFEPYFNYKEKTMEVIFGESHRKWIVEVNSKLTEMLTHYIGDDKWKKDFAGLRGFEAFTNDESLIKDWIDMKLHNKEKLAIFLMAKLNVVISKDSMLDVILGEINVKQRTIMAGLYLLYQYNLFKTEKKSIIPRTVIFGATTPITQKDVILKFLNQVAKLINTDPDLKDLLTVLVIEDCGLEYLERIIPAADLSEYLASPTNCFKNPILIRCAMNGCLILGANGPSTLQLAQEVGKGNLFRFETGEKGQALDIAMRELMKFENEGKIREIIEKDMEDFDSYVASHVQAEECYMKKYDWIAKAVLVVARCGKFSLDKTVRELVNDIW